MSVACVLTGGPEYQILVGGKLYRFEWHWYAGPTVLDRKGNPAATQPAKFLDAATLWDKQGREVGPDGRCVWAPEPQPVIVELFKGHYVEVPDGRDPEEYRQEFLTRVLRRRDADLAPVVSIKRERES